MTDISEQEFERLYDKVSKLTDELRSVEHELDRKIDDVRSDFERADDAIKSDVDSLRHDLMYGR
jgi:predicted translin family RNA/ssDNA-binding protein